MAVPGPLSGTSKRADTESGLKQMNAANERNRQEKVRAAKVIIGRAGVKVPKAI